MPLFQGQSREALRGAYLAAWRKSRSGAVLSPLEAQIVAVIGAHPEYHAWLEAGERALHEEFGPERGVMNPFLHLGLHLAVRDQVATDRPAGIAIAQRRLTRRLGDIHAAEHATLEILAEVLFDAQRSGSAPDEQRYLERIAARTRKA